MKLKCFIVLINLQNKNTFPLMSGKKFRFLKGEGEKFNLFGKNTTLIFNKSDTQHSRYA